MVGPYCGISIASRHQNKQRLPESARGPLATVAYQPWLCQQPLTMYRDRAETLQTRRKSHIRVTDHHLFSRPQLYITILAFKSIK